MQLPLFELKELPQETQGEEIAISMQRDPRGFMASYGPYMAIGETQKDAAEKLINLIETEASYR